LVAKPTYTSDTELLVGSPNATVQAVPGFAAATESLASSYSRAAQSSQVIAPVARQLGLPLGIVAARLAVTPIPDSNIITVVASGPSSAAAQTLARATASELTKYVNQSQAQGGLSTVLAAYRSAARAAIVARNTLRSLRALHSKPPEAAFTKAETAISVTQVRAQALSSEYSAVLQQNESAAGISVLSEPVGASSNRKSGGFSPRGAARFSH
jgi:hypothetical protein